MYRFKNGIVAAVIAIGFTVTPVIAQQNGLVNVEIGDITTGDILSNNRVGVGVAANVAVTVCGLTAQVGVIASQIARTGSFDCQNSSTNQFLQITR